MKKSYLVLTVGLLISGLLVNAQDIQSHALSSFGFFNNNFDEKYSRDMDGSPYLHTDWAKGIVKLANGEVFNGLDLKFDEIDNQLLYKDPKDGKTMQFIVAVTEFKITAPGNSSCQKYFRRVGDTTNSRFCEVIADGNVQFLKHTQKQIKLIQEYSFPTREIVQAKDEYFLKIGNKLVSIKRNERSIITTLADKEVQLKAFIKANKLDLSKDNDAAQLITYYNSI